MSYQVALSLATEQAILRDETYCVVSRSFTFPGYHSDPLFDVVSLSRCWTLDADLCCLVTPDGTVQ